MKGMFVGIVMYFMVLIVMGVGWSLNLYKLVHCDFEAPYKTEIIRTVSILPVIGMFTGWMTIGEEEKTAEN